jgi:hypothetical protein
VEESTHSLGHGDNLTSNGEWMLCPPLQEGIRPLSTSFVSSIDRNTVRAGVFPLDSAQYMPSSKSVRNWGGRGLFLILGHTEVASQTYLNKRQGLTELRGRFWRTRI